MLRLFHSYQYISNTKDINYDYENKIVISKQGEFKLGLLQIPDIPNYKIIIEKYLVSRRQSKKVYYRNHTKHNMKIFINCSVQDLNLFVSELLNKNTNDSYYKIQHKYLFNLLQRNYEQFSLNQNIFDIICVKPNYLTACRKIQKLNIKSDNAIKIGNNLFDLINKKICTINLNDKKTSLLPKKNINIQINGGVFFLDTVLNSKRDFIENKLNLVKSNCSFLFHFEDEIEYLIWKKILKFYFKDTHLTTGKEEFTNGFYICKKQSDIVENVIFIPTQTNVPINNSAYSGIISFFKNNMGIRFKYIWFVFFNYKVFTLNNLISLVNLYNIKKIPTQIFHCIDNIYELSKILIPTTKFNNDIFNKNIKYDSILIEKKLYNILKLQNEVVFDYETKLKNESCCICLNKNVSLVKTQCNHFYCTTCYQNHINIKLSLNDITSCALCRTNLTNTKLTFLHDLENKKHFETISKTMKIFSKKNTFIYVGTSKNSIFSVFDFYSKKTIGKPIKKINDILSLIQNYLDKTSDVTIFLEENENQYSTYDLLKKYNFKYCYLIQSK